MILHALYIFRAKMKEFQSHVILATTNLLVRSIILIIAIDHFCTGNSVIITLLWHFFKSSLNNSSKKPGKTQIDLTKVTTKGKLSCQEKQLFFESKKPKKTSFHQRKENENEKKTQDLENLHFIVNAIRSMLSNKVYQLGLHANLLYSRHKHH